MYYAHPSLEQEPNIRRSLRRASVNPEAAGVPHILVQIAVGGLSPSDILPLSDEQKRTSELSGCVPSFYSARFLPTLSQARALAGHKG